MPSIVEKFYPLFISTLITAITGYTTFNHLTNVRLRYDILSASISISSIFVGFLITTITLIFAMDGTPIIKGFKEAKVYKKLTSYLMQAISTSFFSAIFSLTGLFIEIKEKGPVQLFESIFSLLWLFATSLAILYCQRVILCLAQIIKYYS
jgi:hypothetical protein